MNTRSSACVPNLDRRAPFKPCAGTVYGYRPGTGNATSPRDPMSQDWLWWKRKGEPTRGERKYRLEDAVQRLGWTQVALKTKLCIGQSTLTQYLSGRRQVPLDVLYEVERLAKERAAKRERSE